MSITVVIQAGGQSSRMGQNKALMPFLGQRLIERVRDRLLPVADELLVTTSQSVEELEAIGLPVVQDVVQGKGALGGLYTAILAAKQPLVAVVACDMPFVSPRLIQAEATLLVNERVDVVIPRSPDGLEPLHACFRRETCLPAIAAAIETDQRRLISWFPEVKVRVMEVEEVRGYDPELRAFQNVNTPEEFRRAEALARQAT